MKWSNVLGKESKTGSRIFGLRQMFCRPDRLCSLLSHLQFKVHATAWDEEGNPFIFASSASNIPRFLQTQPFQDTAPWSHTVGTGQIWCSSRPQTSGRIDRCFLWTLDCCPCSVLVISSFVQVRMLTTTIFFNREKRANIKDNQYIS